MNHLHLFDAPGCHHMIQTMPCLEPETPARLSVVASSPYHRHQIRRAASRFVARKRSIGRNTRFKVQELE